MLVWIIGAFAALALAYAFVLRPWIRLQPKAKPFFDWIEPIEATLWAKSRTILIARLYSLAGFLVTMQALLSESGIDWLSLIPIPSEYAKYVGPVLWATGLLFAKLRKITDRPLEKLE